MRKTPITCDWKNKKSSLHNENNPPSPPFSKEGMGGLSDKKPSTQNKSNLYKYKGNFLWEGIKAERYKSTGGDWSDIVRQTLIGIHGETTKFHLRYFEIAPGGY